MGAQPGAQFARKKVTIEIGHDEDIELSRVLDQLHASVVNNNLLILYVRVLLSVLSAALDEESISHLQVLNSQGVLAIWYQKDSTITATFVG